MSSKVIVGKFGGAHGVRGEIKVFSYTDPIENIVAYLPWQVKPSKNADWQAIDIEKHRWNGKVLLVKIHGVEDREITKTYTNLEIAINRDQMPEPAEDEFYWSDLIGMTVYTEDGVELGIVDSHFGTGSNDVMVVKGEEEHYVPYTETVVKDVDLEKKQIIVDWEPL